VSARVLDDLTDASVDAARDVARAPFAVPAEIGDDPAEFRRALIRYWAMASITPVAARLRSLHKLRPATRAWRRRELRGLALFALADADARVVYDAARRYLHASDSDREEAARRIAEVLDWLARHLATRPEAVFAALLVEGDRELNECLRGHRYRTSSARLREVLASLGAELDDSIIGFLREWRALELTTVSAS
jgi:hypothetical protein